MELEKLKNKLRILRIIHYSLIVLLIGSIYLQRKKTHYILMFEWLKNITVIFVALGFLSLIICPIFINKLKSKIENIENIEIALKDRKDGK